jgi:hypothetical protein
MTVCVRVNCGDKEEKENFQDEKKSLFKKGSALGEGEGEGEV